MQIVNFSRKSRDKGLILKHVSTVDGWDAQEVEDRLQLEDGGMLNRLVITSLDRFLKYDVRFVVCVAVCGKSKHQKLKRGPNLRIYIYITRSHLNLLARVLNNRR